MAIQIAEEAISQGPIAMVAVAVFQTDVIALHDHILHAALPQGDWAAAQVAVGNRGWFARIMIRRPL